MYFPLCVLYITMCAAGYNPTETESCVLCGYIQVNNTFKLAPGNATTCTPCSDNAVPNAGYTECGMLISLSQ